MVQWQRRLLTAGLGLGVGLCIVLQPAWANRVTELANQAEALASQGYADSAVELYQRAIVLDSQNPLTRQNPALHFNIALLFMDQRKFPLAMAALEQTVRINPQHLKGHFNLGMLYADLGRATDAEKELSQALALAAGNAQLSSEIIEILQSRKLTESSPTGVSPTPQASPSSGSSTVPPGKTVP